MSGKVMDIKYQDSICKFYNLEHFSVFETIIDGKCFKYRMSGHPYEPRVYFESLDTSSIEFSVGGRIWFPSDDDIDKWKKFCYELIEEIKKNN